MAGVRGHVIEGTVRYLTAEEGGRKSGVRSGYRGQFFYNGDDCDGFQYFPDRRDDEFVPLGETVSVHIWFPEGRWEERHSREIYVGMPFEIHEGARVIGRGTVTALNIDESTWPRGTPCRS